jgi:hypothetical protein
MAAGVTDKLWEIADIVEALERWEYDQANAVERLKFGKVVDALPKVTR